MTDVPLSLDLMQLADIGGNPHKLAQEIHRQLRGQFSSVPVPVPIEEIAKAVGIVEIVDHATDSFDGTLIVRGSKGAIALRRGMNPGRWRFTLGHELGHFLNPYHMGATTEFRCTPEHLRARRDSKIWDSQSADEKREIEANEFSASLLLPVPEYALERGSLTRNPDIEHIDRLRRRFLVSFEALARFYVRNTDEPVAVIISKDALVQKIIVKDFPYLGLRKGLSLPTRSLTHTFRHQAPVGAVSTLDEILREIWIEEPSKCVALYEQVLVQRDGWAATLLMADLADEKEDEDDRNWNRRNRDGARR